jgi:hypothetical protein
MKLLRRQMDRLLDDFLLPGESRLFSHGTMHPSIELDESDGAYTLTAELDAREDFWIIKHGIKMTAMPACGLTNSDAYKVISDKM